MKELGSQIKLVRKRDMVFRSLYMATTNGRKILARETR